jgi:hypothetical protein
VWLWQPAHWGVYGATTIQIGLIRMGKDWIWNLGAVCWGGAREGCPALRAMSRLILGFC